MNLEDEAKNLSVLPLVISENDEPILEIVVCDSISGGSDYTNGMPTGLTLRRKLADGQEFYAKYIQVTSKQDLKIVC